MTGFNGDTTRTLGNIVLTFPIIDKEQFDTKFQVIDYQDHKDALNFDGILGSSFLCNGEAILNYKTKTLDIKDINCFAKLYELHELPQYNKVRRNQIKTKEEILKENLRLDHLEENQRKKTFDTFNEFSNIFHLPGDKLESKLDICHEIKLTNNTHIFMKNYRFPFQHKQEVERQMSDLEKQGIISKFKSLWNTPIWVMSKKLDSSKKRKWRIVVDYRKLNEVTIDDRYPQPNTYDY